MTQKRPPKSDYRESGLVQRLRRSVRQLPVSNPHVLLACSGGKDSVALASLLFELSRLGLLSFAIAHIHHGQHDRADSAANAVSEIGRVLGVPVSVHRLDQKGIDAHIGVGLEEAMRRERYLALASLGMEVSADCIALAHHQSDQAETILLHLMRGAGVDGLAGMREWDIRRIPWWRGGTEGSEIGLWRPIIDEPAEVIADLAVQSSLPIVEDPTNIDPSYRRNAIRHQLIPVLESIAEGATAAIARSSRVISADADLLAALTSQGLQDCSSDSGLSRKRLLSLPEGLQHRVVRAWLLELMPAFDLSADRVSAVIEVALRNRGGAVVQIGAGRTVTLLNGMLHLD